MVPHAPSEVSKPACASHGVGASSTLGEYRNDHPAGVSGSLHAEYARCVAALAGRARLLRLRSQIRVHRRKRFRGEHAVDDDQAACAQLRHALRREHLCGRMVRAVFARLRLRHGR